MAWEDYETLDGTKEVATEEEIQRLRQMYDFPKEDKRCPLGLVNKGAKADIFKKKQT